MCHSCEHWMGNVIDCNIYSVLLINIYSVILKKKYTLTDRICSYEKCIFNSSIVMIFISTALSMTLNIFLTWVTCQSCNSSGSLHGWNNERSFKICRWRCDLICLCCIVFNSNVLIVYCCSRKVVFGRIVGFYLLCDTRDLHFSLMSEQWNTQLLTQELKLRVAGSSRAVVIVQDINHAFKVTHGQNRANYSKQATHSRLRRDRTG